VLDTAERRTLLDVRDESAGDANRLTVAVVDGDDVELALHDASGEVLHRARFVDALLDGEWQHVAVVFDGGHDLEPRLYVDALALVAAQSTSADGAWEMSDSARRVFVAADARGEGHSWRGQLGHVGIWSAALGDGALHEISAMGHDIDLRSPGVEYREQESLLHYWRLGDDANGIGFDYGAAATPLDLDEGRGGIDVDDIVADAPAALTLAAAR
jgi:hypothetical protein